MDEYEEKLSEIDNDWQIVDNKKLHKEFLFGTFMSAIDFINEIAIIAQEEDHHPEIHNYHNTVVIELWTRTADGLTDEDFKMARDIDGLYLSTVGEEDLESI